MPVMRACLARGGYTAAARVRTRASCAVPGVLTCGWTGVVVTGAGGLTADDCEGGATGGLAVRRMVLAPVGRAVCPEWHAEKIASQRDKTWDTEAHAFILPWTDEVRLHSTAVRPAAVASSQRSLVGRAPSASTAW